MFPAVGSSSRSVSPSLSASPRRLRAQRPMNRVVTFGAIEPLESRQMFAVTASAAGGVLTVVGDLNPQTITVSRDVAGNLKVNNGGVAITGSPATVGTINSIHVFGLGGSDRLALDETNGVLPAASLSGGSGNDTLTGGSGNDVISGDDGNDRLFGMAGADSLHGGAGNDTITGGVGTDSVLGDTGNDLMIWNPGDGTDTNDGGDGFDTVQVNGGAAGETFKADLINGRVFFQRTNATPNPFAVDIGTSESLVLNAGDGNDTFLGGTGLAGVMSFVINGQAGDDTLNGTDGNDLLIGGDGNDVIDGNGGTDIAFLGNGKDTFVWDPGDGSDIVHGQGGGDAMIFNGNDADETIDLSNQHGHLRFTRDKGNIVMNTDGLEAVQFNAFGGADKVTIHDLSGTGVTQVDLNLDGAQLRGTGDGAQDSVTVEGRNRDDVINVQSSTLFSGGSEVDVTGLPATVSITGAEATDKLTVKSLAGNDLINALNLSAGVITFTADGGSGNDVILGSAGNDTLLGGSGNDILIGANGTDALNGGSGINILIQ